ncbi:MAG: hypothetical protein RIT81_33535 [Deltaproteobacteria bacterium]
MLIWFAFAVWFGHASVSAKLFATAACTVQDQFVALVWVIVVGATIVRGVRFVMFRRRGTQPAPPRAWRWWLIVGVAYLYGVLVVPAGVMAIDHRAPLFCAMDEVTLPDAVGRAVMWSTGQLASLLMAACGLAVWSAGGAMVARTESGRRWRVAFALHGLLVVVGLGFWVLRPD